MKLKLPHDIRFELAEGCPRTLAAGTEVSVISRPPNDTTPQFTVAYCSEFYTTANPEQVADLWEALEGPMI